MNISPQPLILKSRQAPAEAAGAAPVSASTTAPPLSLVAGPPASGNLSLRVDAVDLVYPTRQGPLKALDGLSFDVPDGKFVSVLGPSGCGKSSLLKLVMGLLPVTGGSISLAGSVIAGPRSEVGIVFQQPTLLPWKTVLENVLVPIRAMKLDVRRGRERAMELLAMMKLEAFANNYPSELSGGMQQRVGIARGLIHDPKLLLMDEPFAALDSLTRDRMIDELQRIWMRTGKSVLFITHSIPEAISLSDRILVLSPRPARVLRSLDVDLPRPRTAATMSDPRFVALAAELRAMFDEMEPS